MFKNALVYRIAADSRPEMASLEERLQAAAFAPCGASQPESVGWVPPRGVKHGLLLESVGGQWVLQLCTETKPVPSQAVKTELEARLDKIEAETGRRPKGKIAKELKEQIVHELLPRAFAKRSRTPVWISPADGWVVVGATATKKADAVVTRLVELLGGSFKLVPLQTQQSPARAMADWLVAQEAPAGFTIDRECELKQPDSEKAAVRYTRHALEIDEVGRHIGEGKQPTQLALTFDGRVSFVLTEALSLKKIKLADELLEAAENQTTSKEEAFDADVALATGELRRLLPALVAALGGELDPMAEAPLPGAAPATPATSVETATAAADGNPPW